MSKNKYNCIVVDDEHLARKLLRDYISKIPELNLVGCYDSPIGIMNDLHAQNVDIIFLDIDMPDLSGIDFAQQLHFKPLVIFVTAFSEYAAKAFEIDAIEYLLKPVTFPRFFKAVNKAMEILSFRTRAEKGRTSEPVLPEGKETPRDFIIIKTERRLIKIPYKDIYFIEGALEYVKFQTRDKQIMGLYSLKKLEEELPADRFMRIHKSYIVSLDKIMEIDGNLVRVGEWKISVSKTFRNELLERIDLDNS